MKTADDPQLPTTEHYLRMQPAELAEAISKRNLPAEYKADLIQSHMVEKKKRKSLNAKERTHRTLWREFLMPLKYEIKNVKVMMNQDRGQARHDALGWYLALMESLHEHCVKLSKVEGNTPASVAKSKTGIWNDGTHWTDWVSATKRAPILDLFEAVQWGKRRKHPFERRIPDTLHKALKARLVKRTQGELAVAVRKLRVANDPDSRELLEDKVKSIRQALAWAHELQAGAAVPTTWGGFYKSMVNKKDTEVSDYEAD